jgi:hypothetical protein
MDSSTGEAELQPRLPADQGPEGPSHAQIQEALSAVLKSTALRASKQSQHLLQYLVEQTLQGHFDMLKERIVGNCVFERSANYDTGNDPIVRVRAADLRKRLAQYYIGEGSESTTQIQIHPGSYQPFFVIVPKRQVAEPAAVGTPQASQDVPIKVEISSTPFVVQPSKRRRWKHFIWFATSLSLSWDYCSLGLFD